ncbi:MAG TPA: ABC transporter ATP-binding protein [Gemmatimonadales bacterium]|nr:ABC transporter ATP-binding protein [Gemmatimonadales bacterium]
MPGSAEPKVRFERVWKRFRRGDMHDSLRDLIPSLMRRALRRSAPPATANRSFWALQDVSFHVGTGEALGIIGANGAGKSTALKLLTRVLGPTHGFCSVEGRVGALIEVSAGFHPDLTGRENVFLHGAVMGMSRSEIARKFDRIVDFSGVEEFLDTPVKRYSSGMNARLGFAIAAHLDPDVLIIDEVLSVGDANFQRKALTRVSELVKSGVPAVLVTHQLDQVTSLCTKALVLERGKVVAEGTPSESIAQYLSSAMDADAIDDMSVLVVKTIRRQQRQGVRPGDTLNLSIEVIVQDLRLGAVQQLIARVSSAITGSVVFEGALHEAGLEAPTMSSWYWADVGLTLHAPPGPYHVEFIAADRRSGSELARAGGVYVSLDGDGKFHGAPRGDMTARLTHAAQFGVANDFAPVTTPDA